MNFRPRHVSNEDFKIYQDRVKEMKSFIPMLSKQTHKRPSSIYSSKWELQYSKVLEVEKRVGAIKDWRYGGITFTLSKGQYHRIDFLIWHNNGQIELAQVKGYHKNLRAGIKGLKWAAQLHPWFSWTIKRWTGTAWDGEYVEI